ncbi:MAG TPA: TlpA disulfide reductase family protein [Candidatus Limnocylindria bacterium]|jgi:thiol-disulfide isomerase/thioredoxin|nr:TlpA disulfide reductase family protein [Candidatus Limnocylindria bacterium]
MKKPWSRWLIPLAIAVVLAVLTSRGRGGPPFMRVPGASGTAPAWSLPDLEGHPVASTNFAGKVVLLNFWATWCPPCRAEIPDLIAFHAAHATNGFTVVGVAMDQEGAAVVKVFAERQKLNYPVLLASADITLLFGGPPMDPLSGGFPLPTTYVIGRDGRLVAHYIGALTRAELDKVVLPLLAAP